MATDEANIDPQKKKKKNEEATANLICTTTEL